MAFSQEGLSWNLNLKKGKSTPWIELGSTVMPACDIDALETRP